MLANDLENRIRVFLQENLQSGVDGAFAYASEAIDRPCWGCEISDLAALWDTGQAKIKQAPFSFVEDRRRGWPQPGLNGYGAACTGQ